VRDKGFSGLITKQSPGKDVTILYLASLFLKYFSSSSFYKKHTTYLDLDFLKTDVNTALATDCKPATTVTIV
jgi:hypothetical protein